MPFERLSDVIANGNIVQNWFDQICDVCISYYRDLQLVHSFNIFSYCFICPKRNEIDCLNYKFLYLTHEIRVHLLNLTYNIYVLRSTNQYLILITDLVEIWVCE